MELLRERAAASLPAPLRPFAGLIHEFGKFGVVGMISLIVDVGLFNILMYAGGGMLADRPLTAKAIADIAAAQSRTGDELRAEIARLSVAAVDHVVTGTLDDATQQQVIENFIARVGATS